MTNTNCLAGIACPKCKSEDRFDIVSAVVATVTDNGTEEAVEFEWDDSSRITCRACQHSGTVAQFTARSYTPIVMDAEVVRDELAERTEMSIDDGLTPDQREAIAALPDSTINDAITTASGDFFWNVFDNVRSDAIKLLVEDITNTDTTKENA